MDKQQATTLIRSTFENTFDEGQYLRFLRELFNGQIDESDDRKFDLYGQYIPDSFKESVRRYKRLGTYTDPDGHEVDLLVVILRIESSLERARTMQRNFAAYHLKRREKETAIIAYTTEERGDWRFSMVRREPVVTFSEAGSLISKDELTPVRRYSFLVGENEPNHTAQQQLFPILMDDKHDPTLDQLENAFNIETVTKEFFERYKNLFLQLKEELDRLTAQNPRVQAEFVQQELDTTNFAKKLLGQIVFLYFLQKKGWLGVALDGIWGTGSKSFLRELFNQVDSYENFFNDILEPLFYEALAIERDDNFYKELNVKIPFLNGGLFEPVGNYDWRNIDILIDNSVFNSIFDTFDLYNFTVREDEPLEKEVAVDPEMLGKVFENLLEVTDRKSKGAFYTPREIVHYMCQESLINYLDTRVNIGARSILEGDQPQQKLFDLPPEKGEQLSLTEPVQQRTITRDDIATFIRVGELAVQNDIAKEAGTVSYTYQMPEAIRANAAKLDTALASIKICDPAIGSGAFPVGMMQEIIKAREVLTTYIGEDESRTLYNFKRQAIQESIYGVDIDPSAIDIAKLRLWLSLVVDEDDYHHIKPLPNLDYKIVCGNSLLSVEKNLFNLDLFQKLEALKMAYFDQTDPEQKYEQRTEIATLIAQLTGDHSRFDMEIYFSEVFHNGSGFDIVIANPPYIFARESKKKGITDKDKKYFYDNYKLAEYQVNLYPLFIEKGTRLLRENGCLCFITPNNWLTINTNKNLRKFALEQSDIVIVNFLAQVFESAAVDSSILIFRKSVDHQRVTLYEFTQGFELIKETESAFFLSQRDHIINIQAFKGDGVSALIQKIESLSISLSSVSSVKAGLMAYETGKGTPPQTEIMKKNRVYHATIRIDKTYFKYLDGRDVSRYCISWGGEYLKYGGNLAAPRQNFRLFSSLRILVRQIPNKPPYCIHACLVEETLLNDRNSMNVINIRELPEYVLGVLNSRLVSFWFIHKFGKMQRGIFPQFKVNELADFPLPKKRVDQKQDIANYVKHILEAKRLDPNADTTALDCEIDHLIYQAYGLNADEIALIEGK